MSDEARLVPNPDGNNYRIEGGDEEVWIDIQNLAIQIKKDNDGVSVNVYAAQREDSGALAEMRVTYVEANERAEKVTNK